MVIIFVIDMLFNNTKNWKEFLSITDEQELNKLLERTAAHRPAFKNAEDVQHAQTWCAMLELKKDISKLNQRLERIEYLLEGMFERDKQKRDELIQSLRTF